MSDLISRQAAIDAADSIINRDTSGNNDVVKAMTAWKEHIKGLPSAQPEPIRLWLDHELSKEEYERLKKDCAEQPIILLPKESAQQWIPCSERRPHCSETVIVSILDDNGDYNLNYTDVGWITRDGTWIVDNDENYMVTAWMPLPEPWRGEEDGKN